MNVKRTSTESSESKQSKQGMESGERMRSRQGMGMESSQEMRGTERGSRSAPTAMHLPGGRKGQR